MKLSKIMIHCVMAGSLLSSLSAQAADLSEPQKKQVQDIVQSYISQHPELIIKSLQTYQQKQMSQSVEKTQSTSRDHVDALFRQAGDPMAGNANGKVTVVEFFDYQCGHCVSMQPVLQGLVKNNPNVKIIFKEFPIRGPMSEMAAKVALYAATQDKYIPLHDALMEAASKGPLTEELIYAAATGAGLDLNQVKAAIKSDAISKKIKSNFELAQRLELMGTPALFVASSDVNKKSPATSIVFIPGEVDTHQLNEIIGQVSK